MESIGLLYAEFQAISSDAQNNNYKTNFFVILFTENVCIYLALLLTLLLAALMC